MNQFQQLIVEHYGDGDFSYIETEDQTKDIGDSLFSFLIVEFSSSEGCEHKETAMSRIDTIIKDLFVIQNQFEQCDD